METYSANNVSIILEGVASSKKKYLRLKDRDDLKLSLLSYLESCNIPIASSCNGEGICKKCIVGDDLLSCQINLKDFLDSFNEEDSPTIKVSYL